MKRYDLHNNYNDYLRGEENIILSDIYCYNNM